MVREMLANAVIFSVLMVTVVTEEDFSLDCEVVGVCRVVGLIARDGVVFSEVVSSVVSGGSDETASVVVMGGSDVTASVVTVELVAIKNGTIKQRLKSLYHQQKYVFLLLCS